MNIRILRFPGFLRPFYPGAVFTAGQDEKTIVLTFDDGPDPLSTPLILDILDKYDIKAFFFCNGRRAKESPELMKSIRDAGHIAGNHGFDHLDGWKLSTTSFVENTTKADAYTSSKYFRPPYGHIFPWQFYKLRKRYKIFFWDVIAYDFDHRISPSECLKGIRKSVRPGSVIVLHDQAKSHSLLLLEDFINYALEQQYTFSLRVCQ